MFGFMLNYSNRDSSLAENCFPATASLEVVGKQREALTELVAACGGRFDSLRQQP
jgi:hypothetical protein